MAEQGTAAGYARPEVLVETAWLADHLNDPGQRIVEANEDILLYEQGHIAGAVKLDWTADLQDPVVRDFIGPEAFAALCGRLGIANDTTVIFYGDRNNWWAAYAYWFFSVMGHTRLKILNGGRKKWIDEGRPLTRAVPSVTPVTYTPQTPRPEYRAFRDDVLAHIGYEGHRPVRPGLPLVDVRSPGEYSGQLLHMPEYPQEGAQRGGHIPGAASIPWARAANEDATFKLAAELRQLYGAQGITPDKDIIVYCRIGERSSHTWFVLHELLGFPRVRNYDGSWTEWGNVVGLPIEK
jgi:thiosulfate/3-mercaptopyruvate sulfurtransferase